MLVRFLQFAKAPECLDERIEKLVPVELLDRAPPKSDVRQWIELGACSHPPRPCFGPCASPDRLPVHGFQSLNNGRDATARCRIRSGPSSTRLMSRKPSGTLRFSIAKLRGEMSAHDSARKLGAGAGNGMNSRVSLDGRGSAELRLSALSCYDFT